MNPELHLELQTSARMAPWTLQSLRMLELNSADLSSYLESALLENPFLEREEYSHEGGWPGASARDDDRPLPEAAGAEDAPWDSLSAALKEQLDGLTLPGPLAALCAYMAELVDEEGCLRRETLQELAELGIPDDLIRQALTVIQSLEPAGVGAADLGQSLLLQLRRRGWDTPLLERVLTEHLEDLARQAFGRIARCTGASEEELMAQCARLRELDPHPAAAFSGRETPAAVCVVPDYLVEEKDGALTIRIHQGHRPCLQLSGQYERMLRETEDEEVRAYLTERQRHARWLMACIQRRMELLESCGQWLLRTQYAFFTGSRQDPLPATMAALAAELGVAPSTVTRALKSKYLQCRRGVYPLAFFFSRPVGGSEMSRRQIQGVIRRLIDGENKEKPLRDQQITELLAAQGIEVNRRTVTKYRQEMGLPAAADRRIAAKTNGKKV